jgi:hypothetical protein
LESQEDEKERKKNPAAQADFRGLARGSNWITLQWLCFKVERWWLINRMGPPSLKA